MLKRMNRNIDIKSRRVQQSVSKLDGFLRAEYNSGLRDFCCLKIYCKNQTKANARKKQTGKC